jgi:hypothetical protein
MTLFYKYIHASLIEARQVDTGNLAFYLVKNRGTGPQTWFELDPYAVW